MNNPLVAHVVEHALPEVSGYSVRSHNLLRASQRGGRRVLAIVPRIGAGEPELSHLDEVPYLHLPCGRSLASISGHLTSLPRFWSLLATALRQHDAALVHAHSPVRMGMAALRAGRRVGIPVVYELRGLWEDTAVLRGNTHRASLRSWGNRVLETNVLRRSDGVVAISRGLASEALKRGVRAQSLAYAPNGVEAGRFTPKAPDPELIGRFDLAGRFVIGYLGFFPRYEGVDILVRAFAAVAAKHPQSVLLLVGEGDMGDELRGLVRELGVADQVRFAGRAESHAVPAMYQLCDVLAYPRRSSRVTELVSPLKPLEAMASARAVVASRVGGLSELVTHEDSGLLCAPDDVASLAATLVRLVESPELVERLRLRGQCVAEELTWDRSVEGYEGLYARLLAGRQARGAR